MKALKQNVKKLVVLGMYKGARQLVRWTWVTNFLIASRAKAQRRTDPSSIDTEVEAEELRVRLQRHRQRHQVRLQRKWDNQKESARIAHEEHRARMRQMEEEHQAKMRKMEEEHQVDMKIHREQMKVRLQELEGLDMLQQEQILQKNDTIFKLEDRA